ncbi:hypothetical protein [Streptomyces sp. NPDC089919]|uniref:hypothetical protein n=1 Tax=Streptomyces sp. NPDC089919 TaxID=3155188 RepID=UPI003426A14C
MAGRHRKPSAATRQKQALRLGAVTAPLAVGIVAAGAGGASAAGPTAVFGSPAGVPSAPRLTQVHTTAPTTVGRLELPRLPKSPSPNGVKSGETIPGAGPTILPPTQPYQETLGDHLTNAATVIKSGGAALGAVAAVSGPGAAVAGPAAIGASALGYTLQGAGWVANNGDRAVGAANQLFRCVPAADGSCPQTLGAVSDSLTHNQEAASRYWADHEIHRPNRPAAAPGDTAGGALSQAGDAAAAFFEDATGQGRGADVGAPNGAVRVGHTAGPHGLLVAENLATGEQYVRMPNGEWQQSRPLGPVTEPAPSGAAQDEEGGGRQTREAGFESAGTADGAEPVQDQEASQQEPVAEEAPTEEAPVQEPAAEDTPAQDTPAEYPSDQTPDQTESETEPAAEDWTAWSQDSGSDTGTDAGDEYVDGDAGDAAEYAAEG